MANKAGAVTISLAASLASDLAVLFHAARKELSLPPAVFGNLIARIVLPPR
jgi:hypothetical protein